MRNKLFFLTTIWFGSLLGQSDWQQMMNQPGANLYQIKKAFENQRQNKPYERGQGIKQFHRWYHFWEDRINDDGSFPPADIAWKELNKYKTQSRKRGGNWTPLGPFTHKHTTSWAPGQGRINAIAVDPKDKNTIYVGAPVGGIWKTTDAGANWTPLGDFFSLIGVSGIAIHPNDNNTIYIGTGDFDGGNTYGIGVLKSTDGGLTWAEAGDLQASKIGKILIHPDNPDLMFAQTNLGIYRSDNAGDDWYVVTGGFFEDIAFKPGDPSVIHAVTKTGYFRSTDGGSKFDKITEGLPTANVGRLKLGVTPANPDYIYIFAANSSHGFRGVYRSTDSGESFTTQNTNTNVMEGTQAWYDMAFCVSSTDADMIFTGVINVWRSGDGGKNFTKINHWSNPAQSSYTHADIHFLHYFDDQFMCGSDGGIYVSKDNGNLFTNLTDGLQIGQFYTISGSEQDPDVLAGGLQDNGGYVRYDNVWKNYAGADGMESAVSPFNPIVTYGMIQNGSLYKTTTGGENYQDLGSPMSGRWVTPMQHDPNVPDRIIAGYNQLYQFQGTWKALSDYDFGENLKCVEIHPGDPKVIFVATNNKIYRTENGGTNWTDITRTLSGVITSIESHPTDSKTLWVTLGSYSSGKKVFKTSNGGYLWENISDGLPNFPANIVKREDSDVNGIYVGMEVGVYYRNDTMDAWIDFSDNLPNTTIKDFEINEVTKMIRVATYGRGIWESNTYNGGVSITSDAALFNNSIPSGKICGSYTPKVKIRNIGDDKLTSATVTLLLNGEVHDEVEWTGEIGKSESAVVTFDDVSLPNESNTIQFELTADGDQIASNNQTTELELGRAPRLSSTEDFIEIEVFIKPDAWGDETTWVMFDPNDKWIQAGGPYERVAQNQGGTWVSDTTKIKSHSHSVKIYSHNGLGCYTFEIYDSGSGGAGDGMWDPGSNYGRGYYELKHNGNLIGTGSQFGAIDRVVFEAEEITSSSTIEVDNIRVFPNPTASDIYIQSDGTRNLEISLFNSHGQRIYNRLVKNAQRVQIPVGNESKGVYFLEIEYKNKVNRHKIIRY